MKKLKMKNENIFVFFLQMEACIVNLKRIRLLSVFVFTKICDIDCLCSLWKVEKDIKKKNRGHEIGDLILTFSVLIKQKQSIFLSNYYLTRYTEKLKIATLN